MATLSTGYLCDEPTCAEFHRGATFPAATAAATWSEAYAAGWRDNRHTVSEARDGLVQLCPACVERAARKARRCQCRPGVISGDCPMSYANGAHEDGLTFGLTEDEYQATL